VPTFVADDRYAIVGAHPYENFQKLMAAVAQEAES
jgi:predicted DsbA family dithiol-disulfide isomerase